MPVRRPPSARDALWTAERTLQGLRKVTPGGLTGKSPNAAPLRAGRTADVAARRGVAGPAGATVLFTRDRFPASGTLAAATTSETLSHAPLAGSLHLYVNGLELVPADYALDGASLTLTAGVAEAGDVLEARYAHSSTAATLPAPAPDEFADDFDRVASPLDNGWTGYTLGGGTGIVLDGTRMECPTSTSWVATRDVGFTVSEVTGDPTAAPSSSGGFYHLFAGTSGVTAYVNWTGVSVSQGQYGELKLWRWVAGAATEIAGVSGTRNGDPITLRNNGGTLEAWRAGVLRLSAPGYGDYMGTVIGLLIGGDSANGWESVTAT